MALVAFLAASTATRADGYPNRTIRILVGFPAGGPSDVPARLLAARMKEKFGPSVGVENKAGAAGMVAVKDMLAQPADGHTLLLCSYLDMSNTVFQGGAGYEAGDLEPIGLVSKGYYAFASPANSNAASLQEFVAMAKARPGQLRYGTVGGGSITGLLAVKLEHLAGISMQSSGYNGTVPALLEVAAGRLDLMVAPVGTSLPLARGGAIKILGITSTERLDVAPDLRTLVEQGLDIVNHGWWGVCAAAGTPKPIVRKLNGIIRAVVDEPGYRWAMSKVGMLAAASHPDELRALMKQTLMEAKALQKDLGISPRD